MHRFKALLLLLPIILALVLPLTASATGLFAINGANVFSGYRELNDWLIVINYQNTLDPYYNNAAGDPSAFQLQLTTASDTVIAQTPLVGWGYKPGSIYLNANMTSTLEWGSGYKVKMVGTANSTSYTLTSADWRGSDLSILDSWCLALASGMQNYYNVTFLAPSATGETTVLNKEGGVIFLTGIPGLLQYRPDLFQVSISTPSWETENWTNAYSASLPTWEVAVGPNIASILNDAGAMTNLPGEAVGAIILFIIYLALALGVLAMGHGLAGLVLALPIMMLVWYFNFIPFAVLGIIIAIAAFFLVRQLFWKTT